MKLPNAGIAFIEDTKLRDYVLSPSHPTGQHKARVFVKLGYSQDRWRELEADLRAQHLTQEAEPTESSQYGQKYEIRAMLTGPAGTSGEFVSVWIIRSGEDVPRLVTVKPGEKP